jgi:hypothetical protein
MNMSQSNDPKSKPRRRRVIIAAVVCSCLAIAFVLLFQAVQRVREAASRMVSSGQLCQIGIAILNYDSVHGHLPPQAACDKDGKKLLSWRVEILPYIEQEALYLRFKRNEPWDSPDNRALIPLMPKSYAATGTDPTRGETYYKVFAGKNTAFELILDEDTQLTQSKWNIGLLIKSPRGHSNVILCVQAADPVIWTKPDDIDYDPNLPLPEMKRVYSGGILAVMADDQVVTVRKRTPESTWRAYIEPNSTSKESLDD